MATTLAQGLPRELGDRGKTPDALITVPQPHGTAGPLLYPSYGPGAQGLVLDFATVHPMHGSANGYIPDTSALDRVFHHKIAKHNQWLDSQNYRFAPVVTDTSGVLHPVAYRLLYGLAWLKADAHRIHTQAPAQHLATREQHRGVLYGKLRTELTLFCLKASGTRLTGKHWALPLASPRAAGARSRALRGNEHHPGAPLVPAVHAAASR